jgi:hypothetical protein
LIGFGFGLEKFAGAMYISSFFCIAEYDIVVVVIIDLIGCHDFIFLFVVEVEEHAL